MQKRFIAKGKSLEITSMTLSFISETLSLKTTVDFWHTGVSRLGTMLKILFFPLKVDKLTLFKSESTNKNSGAGLPAETISELVLTSFPFNVTLAINIDYNDMVKKKSTKNWLNNHKKDKFVQLSQSSDYRSRAFYKLHEIDKKYKIFKSTNSILDLGSSPGSWSEYISRNYQGKNIIAIDVIDMKAIKNVDFMKGDINNPDLREKINRKIGKADLVLSDIAPNITGIENVDQANFIEILESIMSICSNLLKNNGVLVMKFFIGSSYDIAREELNKTFNKVATYKPASSRSKSNEVFFICDEYKANMIENNRYQCQT